MAHETIDIPFQPGTGTYEIVFDGGSLGNPGRGYGSFELTCGNTVLRHVRHEYGNNITNNQAEYQTLIEALTWLANGLGRDASRASVTVNGDSLLVINQLLGKWKVKNEGLRPLHAAAREQLNKFGTVNLFWHDRSKSVARLGH